MEKIMLIADKIQLGSFIVSLIGVILTAVIFLIVQSKKHKKEKKIALELEIQRDENIQTLLKEIQSVKKTLTDHKHDDIEQKLREFKTHCALRESGMDNVVKALNGKIEDHLQIIHELKVAIQPLHRIETNIQVITERMTNIDALLNEKMINLKENQEKTNDRVSSIEKNLITKRKINNV